MGISGLMDGLSWVINNRIRDSLAMVKMKMQIKRALGNPFDKTLMLMIIDEHYLEQ